jgi:aryl sulfotransferase
MTGGCGAPRSILHSAIHKSGNTWLARILRRIEHHAGVEHRSWVQGHPIHSTAAGWKLSYRGQADMDFLRILPGGCYWRISDLHQERVGDIEEYVRRCSIVWSHEPVVARHLEVLPLFDRIVYLIRDPRDVAVSLSRYVFTSHVLTNWPPHYERTPESFLRHALDQELRDWVGHVGGWLRIRPRIPFHIVFYERLLHAFDAELRGLVGYLGVDLPEPALARIREEVSFRSMHGVDPDHVRAGRSGQWITALSERQNAHAVAIAGPMLELLGYPLTPRGIEAGRLVDLPRIPTSLDATALEAAMARARRGPWDQVRRVAGFALGDRSLRVKANRVKLWTRDTLLRRGDR